MDVSDVKVTDEDGFLFRSMMIKAKNTIMKERTWINRVAQRDHDYSICIQDTLHDERIITVREEHRLHVRMSKKSGRLHGEVDAFDSHEQGWPGSRKN